jgi:hypothetical protein
MVGRVAPQGGNWGAPTITEFTVGAGSSPTGIAAGPDGNVWFTDNGATPAIGRITPQGVITEYSIGLSPGASPWDIARGDDGTLWFTDHSAGGAIGRITTAGVITEFPGATGTPEDITNGPDGNMWFTTGGGPGAIGRITRSGTITMFSSGLTPNQSPTGIVAGDNGWLYFAERGGNGALGSITPHGTITEYTTGLTGARAPWGVSTGADGNVWFAENASPGALGKLTLPPDADTTAPAGVTDHSATLQGTVTPNSQSASYYFEYGPTIAYGSQTPTASAGSAAGSQSETAGVADLSPTTTYHYRIVASNGSGATRGPDRSFSTQSPPASPTSSNPSPVTPAGAGDNLSLVALPSPKVGDGKLGELEPGGEQPGELTPSAAEPPPVLGRSVVVADLFDRVSVRVPGAKTFTAVSQFRRIPVGSVIDAREGKLRLTSAAAPDPSGHSKPGSPTPPPGGQRQSGVFWGGIFKVTQTTSPRPETELTLVGGSFAHCRGAAPRGAPRAQTARARRPLVVRTLWGRDHHGAFQTHGSNSVATVRGTKWLTQDRCDGTLTQVLQGAVSVRNLHSKRSVLVRANHQYLARARH